MGFLLFDFGATLVFLAGYMAVVAAQGRRAVVLTARSDGSPRELAASAPARDLGRTKDKASPKNTTAPREPRREWPRLTAPR